MSEVFFTGGIVGGLSAKYQMRKCTKMKGFLPVSGQKKADRLPLSDPPSRFLSYPKISLGEKVFVVAQDKCVIVTLCQIEILFKFL